MNTVLSSKPAGGAAQPRVEHVVVVGARNQLRQRRRAARQQHRRHVGRAGVRATGAGASRQAGQRELAGRRFAGHEHVLSAGELGLHLLRHRPEVEAADDVGDDVGDRAGSAQEVPHLGVAVRAQRHHRNGADHV